MKILVIGDSCIDEFNYGVVSRLAPESPVPVLNIQRSVENHGMAGNVYQNILSHIKKSKFDIEVDLITNNNWKQIKKVRFVEENINHMFLRVDYNDFSYNPFVYSKELFAGYDLIVVSDYNKGFLSIPDLIKISETNPLTIIDTKRKLDSWVDNFTYLKINTNEYLQNKTYIDKFLSEKAIITLGNKGCSLGNKVWNVPKVEIKDVAGAGDSFLAGFSIYFLKTKDIDKAIQKGNEFATAVVQKKGVCTYD